MRRRTKIICTIGPATASFEGLKALYEAGMNIVRINMSHSNHDSAAEIINWIKTLNRQVKYPVPVLLDTQGPEIRTGVLENPMELNSGDVVTLSVRDGDLIEQRSIHVNYTELVEVVEVGRIITVDNGLMNFRVLQKKDHQLTCEVIDGGTLGSRKHVNLPGVRVNLPAITAKDRDDIAFGMANDVDFIALSFVRSPDDVVELQQFLGSKRKSTKIVAKIEDQEGVTNIHQIVAAADGVMVARGDLGIETDIADLPNVQRRIVHACARQGKRCIVATHLLESMIDNPIPTRAEVTDVANAIYEGVDAVMLSGETSVGQYPSRCVEQLSNIADRTERFPGLGYEKALEIEGDKQHVAVHAVALAESVEAAGIIVITRRGIVADYVTAARPQHVPIFAFTNNSQTRRRLAMNRSVYAHRIAFSSDPEKTLRRAFDVLKKEGAAVDAKLVLISDVLAHQPTEAIQIRRLY
ncbi:MAG: pyruvate kinase [Pseudomonadota bacterium]|nr:pyruvate kinase [Pseudomonadota bacterium]MEC8143979.1 pyruvate kinase [Pseudomonadota bacterium]MEC8346470.1 pyruvate kinase [Pseudomonadota bacterium]